MMRVAGHRGGDAGGPWYGPERRRARDGRLYTKEQFTSHFGADRGSLEWSRASRAAAAGGGWHEEPRPQTRRPTSGGYDEWPRGGHDGTTYGGGGRPSHAAESPAPRGYGYGNERGHHAQGSPARFGDRGSPSPCPAAGGGPSGGTRRNRHRGGQRNRGGGKPRSRAEHHGEAAARGGSGGGAASSGGSPGAPGSPFPGAAGPLPACFAHRDLLLYARVSPAASREASPLPSDWAAEVGDMLRAALAARSQSGSSTAPPGARQSSPGTSSDELLVLSQRGGRQMRWNSASPGERARIEQAEREMLRQPRWCTEPQRAEDLSIRGEAPRHVRVHIGEELVSPDSVSSGGDASAPAAADPQLEGLFERMSHRLEARMDRLEQAIQSLTRTRLAPAAEPRSQAGVIATCAHGTFE
eukprot:TRINITY_DN9550_c0_g1_i1.p1 TRINITY_DN9550_c0_g1~~TRINITY_DN9550_c0_g1_i1.p1  ORF type:complete len:446 (+),score=53.91 TRINITY_DN9550_c0_g1_i1:105-1340(+)